MAKDCLMLRNGNGDCFKYCQISKRATDCFGDIIYCRHPEELKQRLAVIKHPLYVALKDISNQASIKMGVAANVDVSAYRKARDEYLSAKKVLNFLDEQKEITLELLDSPEFKKVLNDSISSEDILRVIAEKMREMREGA